MQPRILKNRGRRSTGAFTLIEIMIVVMIIGVLLAIAVPNLSEARETTYRRSCIENLHKIQVAKNCYLMDHNKSGNSPASDFTDAVMYGTNGYLRAKPLCPGGGTYSINDGPEYPTCDYNSNGHVHVATD
jgi:prepilin-type N-terminal cleavage/methylation domain-containing protein